MKSVRSMRYLLIALIPLFIMFGCGKTADETKPLSEVKAEAAKMDVDGLREMALKYKEAIQAKLEDAGKIKEELKGVPLTEMLGEKAKELKQELEPITKSINALKERFNVYYNELKKKSGDLSGLKL